MHKVTGHPYYETASKKGYDVTAQMQIINKYWAKYDSEQCSL